MSPPKIKKGSNSHSAYNLLLTFSDVEERHTLAVLVAVRSEGISTPKA